MGKHDFWTTVIAAAVTLLAASPALIAPPAGTTDNYGPFRWLLILGPLAMVVLAWWDLRRAEAEERSELETKGGSQWEHQA
jgi:hypothetical protein